MRKAKSLKVTFYTNIALALILPLFLMSVLTVFTSYRSAKTQMVADSKRIVILFSDIIRNDIHDSEMELKQIAQHISSKDVSFEEMPPLLQDIYTGHSDFMDVRILDTNGIVQAVAPFDADVMGLDMSNAPQLSEAARTGKVTWSKAYISQTSGKPVASISVPFPQGVITANYDFINLRHSVEQLAPEEGLTISVLDSAGTILAHSDPSKVLRRDWDSNGATFIDLATKKIPYKIMHFNEAEHLVTATQVSATGWTLVVSQNLDAAMAAALQLTYTYTFFASGFLLLGLLFALTFSNKFFSYFNRLTLNIQSVAEGTYELKPVTEEFKELAEVGEKFRAMSVQISTREEYIEELNEELKLRLGEAEAANSAKSEFLANMSHELRTPLNGALGMLQLLQTCALNKEEAEYTATAIRSCKNLTTLLNDILDLSRIEANRMTLNAEPFRISDIYSSLDDIFSLTVQEKGIDLILEKSPVIPDVQMGDPIRIKQILFNLVGNAAKFTFTGHIKVEAYPLPPVQPDTYRIFFAVSDTGIGIDEDKLETIFEPFTQAEGSFTRKFGGAGLGLSIVKRLVNLMDGTITIESSRDTGTTVSFCLTLGVPPQIEVSPETPAIQNIERSIANTRVLVAEDEEVNRLMIKGLLRKQGIEPVCVENGREVLAALTATPFDMILMDVQMPIMDGVAATKEIRTSDQPYANIPIIAVTAYAMAGDKDVFLQEGFSDYLSKPLELDDLLEVIKRNRWR